ncbi:MAG TPA: RNA polymerase sporulation sigma factor SigH [Armatimonadota bacterium]|nr:RNA polymerase sporulation sigma factor SigH [Armatimonadota bacterium]
MHPESLGDYGELTDEEIALHAKDSMSAVEHLLGKYRGLVEGKARSYFLVGADREDIVQEGMIGLFKAIRDFRTDKQSRFRAFAELCVTRQIITAVKTATRQKHVPLNRYMSLSRPVGIEDDSDGTLMDILPDACVMDPEKLAVDTHMRECLTDVQSEMSRLESRVLRYYMQGMSYREMATLLACRTKSVDNALQRAKRKISSKLDRLTPT